MARTDGAGRGGAVAAAGRSGATGGAPERAEVAVVGGGPAGAATAALLARAGRSAVLFERAPVWRWRAGGVFTSPATVAALRRLGLAEDVLGEVARPIPAMRVETARGTTFRLTYGADAEVGEGSDAGPSDSAVGLDRSRLDPALLDLARAGGADVRVGVNVVGVDLDRGRLIVDDGDGDGEREVHVEVIVGADGPRSIVARTADVARPVRLAPRIGLTYHLPDADGLAVRDARMLVIRDGYVGIAPVPGQRVNVGIVLGPSWREAVAADGARAVVDRIVQGIPAAADDPGAWRFGEPTDQVEGAWPVGHRVTRRAGGAAWGPWLLVGDAAGFLDPFTGEGLHRALVSAELAAAAIDARLRRGHPNAFEAYERAMTRRFLTKDVVSWLVQAFLARPVLFDYAARRIASRSSVRATMGLVMGDLIPASRALDPRLLAALLAP